MVFGSFCSLLLAAISPTSFWISLWLLVAACLLFLVGLSFLWLSGRSAKTMNGKPASTPTSQHLKAQWALQQLKLIGPKLCWGVILLAAGWGIHDLQEYHSTYVLANAAVEGQQDVYLSYHFVDDPRRRTYGIKFCDDYVPDLQPHQIIEVMIKLRRINGVPILEGE